jgi:glycerate kinase
MQHVKSIDTSPLRDLGLESLTIACDVRTPFRDAVAVFAPQKGAHTAEARAELQHGMEHLRSIYRGLGLGRDVWEMPGTGAAGGVPGALVAAFSGIAEVHLQAGVDVVATASRLADRVREADVVVTGEGSYDAQTGEGKAPSLVIQLARAAGKRCIVVCGRSTVEPGDSGAVGSRDGPDAIIALASLFPLERCMKDTAAAIEEAVAGQWDEGRGGL